jgi:glucose-1-phosphate adenylyltransferase
MDKLLTVILAGGEGKRLMPLTQIRSKAAVPFGGKYRIIDFTLSNCINSGLRQIFVLTQYRSSSLNKHIQEGWHISGSGLGNEFIYSVPAQQKTGNNWYRGTADALRQNLDLIAGKDISDVLVLSGDHIYKMNYQLMLDFHRRKGADLTISALRVKKDVAAGNLGVIEADKFWKMNGFEEKPHKPKTIQDDPESSLVSMGVYIFKVSVLIDVLHGGEDDFGKDVIPYMMNRNNCIYIYDYENENKIEDYVVQVKNGVRQKLLAEKTRDSCYWRDVGTIESYYESSMDLIGVDPMFNLYGEKWPFRTYQREIPPTKIVLGGSAQESILSDGCIISGGRVWRSVLSPEVVVERDAVVDESILFNNVTIEPGVRLRRTIVDKNVTICSGISLGFDLEADRRKGCHVFHGGIVVVPKDMTLGRC